MTGLLLALVLAQDPTVPSDVPLVTPVIVVSKGQPAPDRGLWMSEAHAIEQAKRVAKCEAAHPVLVDGVQNTVPWWVLPVVGAVAVGVGVGVGLSLPRR